MLLSPHPSQKGNGPQIVTNSSWDAAPYSHTFPISAGVTELYASVQLASVGAYKCKFDAEALTLCVLSLFSVSLIVSLLI